MKKTIKNLLFISTIAFSSAQAVTVDEIIDGLFENTGGLQAWEKVNGMQMKGDMNQGGMKFPVEMVQLKDGRQYMQFNFQGKTIKQGVYDGENMWSINFMTMKAEKSDAESTANMKLELNDFPTPFINYKEKGYTVELLGKEEKEGTDTYKVKLIKEPKTVDGKEIQDISFYYFDVDSYVPLVMEAEITEGPAKGKIGETKFSDYQEVDGLYFPFSITQGLKDGPSAPIIINSIVLNPVIEDSEFKMPTEPVEVKVEKKDDTKVKTDK